MPRAKRRRVDYYVKEFIDKRCDPPWIKEQFINTKKGRGVIAVEDIQHGQFLAQYAGKLLTGDVGRQREECEDSVFRFFFKWHGKAFCIDATEEPTSGPQLGRLVNHGDPCKRNSTMKVITVDSSPLLCLFSTRSLTIGTEVLYDYGLTTDEMHWKKPMDTTETRGQASPCIGIDEEAPEETTCTEMLKDTVRETRGQASPCIDIDEEASEESIDSNTDSDSSYVPSSGGTDDEDNLFRCSDVQLPSTSAAPNEPGSIHVQMTNNDGKRVFDKRYPCLYCQTMQSQIQRHLRDVHGEEHEVAAIQNEKDRKEKQKKMTLLRNKGTHRHNCTVLRNGEGTIHVVYRPAYQTSADDYGPCEHCLGYYVRTDLWKHNCPLKPSHQKKKHERLANTCKLLLPPPRGVSAGLNKVLLTMKKDKISRIAKSDNLIIEMAERQYRVHGHDKDKLSDIRNKMRESGRLLSKLRKRTENKNAPLSEFIHPRKFRTVLAAVQEVVGYNEETHQYKIPSLALKLGHTLQKMAKVQQGKGSESGDDNMYHNAKKFSECCTSDWSCFISSNALRTLHEQKRNRVELLPLTEDVVHLTNFLKERGRRSYHRLAEDMSDSEAWNDLNEVTLAQVTMFNRRGTGEMSKMKLSDYKKIDGIPDSTVVKSLSKLEKELCKKLSRVELVGKRGRTVPALLTSEMEEWMSALVDNRQQAGVNPENEYLFARSHNMSLGHIRASDCLRKFSYLSEVKHPETITGTLLRKQLGTLCQLLNLKENEMDIVANFLGHDLHVHREFYRLPNEVLQVAKVSKILLTMEQGGEGLSQGETLDNVPVLNEELGNDDFEADVVSDAEDAISESHSLCLDAESLGTPERDTKRKHPPKTKNPNIRKWKQWSSGEKAAVQHHFHRLLLTNTLPGKSQIEQCLKEEPILHKRTWRNIKDYIRNSFKQKIGCR